MGCGEVCVALLLEICGPAAGTFCFTSQVSASCRRGLHQTPPARPLANSHFIQLLHCPGTAVLLPFLGSPRPSGWGGWGLSRPLRCQSPVRYLQSAPAHIAHSGLPVSKTMPHSIPDSFSLSLNSA